MALLISAEHRPENIEAVITFLQDCEVHGKKVMLEISSFPIKEKYWQMDEGFCMFYDTIAKHLLSRGAELVMGDSEEILDRLDARRERAKTYSERVKIFCEERDPHFYEQLTKHNPDIVILGGIHINNLHKLTGAEYVRIATSRPIHCG